MKTFHTAFLAASALCLAACTANGVAAGQTQPPTMTGGAAFELKAFPAARDSETRHVILLPVLSDETERKVELIVGKTVKGDCNTQVFAGALEERTAQGWGYTYYVLESLGQSATTLMGCPQGSERTMFVRSATQPLVRYNSRLPLVVYAPEDVEVRYRVWRAGDEQRVAAN